MSGATRTILIIDDNSYIRAILSNHLKTEGYETIEAADGISAMERVSEGGVDLILLDVMMPDLDGIEVLKRLKQAPATAKIPVVMVSAYGQRENIIRATRETVDWKG